MKKLVILGGPGIGMIAASIARELGYYHIVGFLNDFLKVGSSVGKYLSYPVLGGSELVADYLQDDDVEFFVAYVGMKNEEETFRKVQALGIPRNRMANLIHPTAIIPKGMCSIGRGVLMAPLSQLSPDTTLEDNCILLPNSFLGHDSIMKQFSHIATNAVVGANVVVGRGVHIGSNATIREKVQIGDFALVGASSLVLKDVESNRIVIGNPAQYMNDR